MECYYTMMIYVYVTFEITPELIDCLIKITNPFSPIMQAVDLREIYLSLLIGVIGMTVQR